MTDLIPNTMEMVEDRVVRFAERPLTFEEFLALTDEDDAKELIGGVLVEKMAAQLDHEKLFAWLLAVIGAYVEKQNLGIVLGSRTAVEISEFGGRLPDILFVRRERMDIVQERAIYGAPDLIIEIVSPNDRPSDIFGLETDYRRIGVPEIVFIERQKGRIRLLRKRESGYEASEMTEGILDLETVGGLSLQAAWLLREPRPTVYDTLAALLSAKR